MLTVGNLTDQCDVVTEDQSVSLDIGADASMMPPMTETLRRRILFEWNNTRADYPDLCVHELFEQQVERTPDAVAVVGAEKSLSYRELNQRANQVANYLRARGVGPETLVGVCLQRSPEMLIALLGVWKAGGAYVPLDSSYPEERLSFMVDDASIRVMLTDERCERLLPFVSERPICLDSDWPLIGLEEKENRNSGTKPSNLAYVMYTSGSTGKPKGAMILHRGLVNYLWWAIQAYRVREVDTVPVHSSISFDLTVTSLYPALLVGGRLELLPDAETTPGLLSILRRRSERTLIKITPAHLDALTSMLSPQEMAGARKTFVIGGENLLAEGLTPWREFAPATRLINEYGPTETVVGCCIYEVVPEDPGKGSVQIGRPIANTQLYILDDELQPVPPGVKGELYVGGAGVARGYLNRPELTRERFLPDPFSADRAARIYRTGDLAKYREDGMIEYLGRVDNQVKIRGYRVELSEIEAALASYWAVQGAVVLARDHAQNGKQIIAYLVPRDGKAPLIDELEKHLSDRLPAYMVPSTFVFLDHFPLTHNGKIDRQALLEPSREPARCHQEGEPRNETERSLVAAWMQMFRLEQVSIYDDFFDLGGNSLLAIRAISHIRGTLGIELPVQILFEKPTIASLSESLSSAETGKMSSTVGLI